MDVKCFSLFFFTIPLLWGYETCNWYKDGRNSKSRAHPLASWFSKLTWIFLSIFKWRFMCSKNGHKSPPPLCWLLNLNQLLCSKYKLFIWRPFLEPHPNHIPLKHRCHSKKKKNNQIRVVYLIFKYIWSFKKAVSCVFGRLDLSRLVFEPFQMIE